MGVIRLVLAAGECVLLAIEFIKSSILCPNPQAAIGVFKNYIDGIIAQAGPVIGIVAVNLKIIAVIFVQPITGAKPHKGNLWLSTQKGISKFNSTTGMFTNYDEKDGLQSNFFTYACHQDKSGRMYFGGINGFNEFYPDRIRDNTYIPPVVFYIYLIMLSMD